MHKLVNVAHCWHTNPGDPNFEVTSGMEETLQVVFRNLYTGFLLRDFAGKIVPGIYLLFSVASMFCSPSDLSKEIRKYVPVFAIFLLAGFAWTVTLGTQSLAEGLGIWRYFPVGSPAAQVTPIPRVGFWKDLFQGGDETSFDASTAKVDLFQSGATEDEKQQYERFVVIKEACGNLFIAGLLSFPAWLFVLVNAGNAEHQRHGASKETIRRNWGIWTKKLSRNGIGVLYLVLVMVGLHRMNAQHVRRQLRYTEIIMENRKNQPQNSQSAIPKPEKGKNP
jgi:hypothetical protein